MADDEPGRWITLPEVTGNLLEEALEERQAYRLDAALLHDAETEAYIVLSRGTTHKPPPRNARGFPVDESVASAQYLVEHGVEPSRILQDTWSVDTVGNVAFTRLMLIEPRSWGGVCL